MKTPFRKFCLPAIAGVALLSNAHAQSLTDGLVAYYPFNGNANDATGNGHDGTVTGATLTTDRFGQPNAAYLFGGPAAHITAPLSSSVFADSFTIAPHAGLISPLDLYTT